MTRFYKIACVFSLAGSFLSVFALAALDCWTDVCREGGYTNGVYDPRISWEANDDFFFIKSLIVLVFCTTSLVFMLAEIKKNGFWSILGLFRVVAVAILLFFMFISFLVVENGGRLGPFMLG